MGDEKTANGSTILKGVRIAFAEGVFVAKGFEGGDPRYSCTLLIEKGSDADKTVQEAIKTAATTAWNKKADDILESIKGRPQTCCYYSGDLKDYDGFAGHMALSTVRYPSKGAPLVIDRDKSPLSRESGRPYSGCIVNAKVQIWAQDNQYGKGMRCTLETVQFSKDAEAFGGGGPATADGFEEEESADDLM